MNRYKITWICYFVGSVLVFGSWMNLVPTGLAWIGWFVALGAWWLGKFERPQTYSRSRTNEIANLDMLRKEGVVTEEEFQKEKARILREP